MLRLGAVVLSDGFKTAVQIMKPIGPNDAPTQGDYKEWPAFKVFRTSPEFAAAFEDVFGKAFGEVAAKEVPDKKDGVEADQ
jgi:hypothetical protein